MRMKRTRILLLAAVSALLMFSILAAVSGDVNWTVGDLSKVATKLGVPPNADGKYVLADLLVAIEKRLLPAEDIPLFIRITNPGFSVKRGNPATVLAKTLPGAQCAIRVNNPFDHKGTVQGLEDKQADENGDVFWSWPVDDSTPPGEGLIIVQAVLDRETAFDETPFTIATR